MLCSGVKIVDFIGFLIYFMARGLQNYKIGFQPFLTSFSDLSLSKRYNQECLFSVQTL